MFTTLSKDMVIPLQASSVHALISSLYILQCVNKKHPFTIYPAAKHQNTANLALQTYNKSQWIFFMIPHMRRL